MGKFECNYYKLSLGVLCESQYIPYRQPALLTAHKKSLAFIEILKSLL